MEQNTTTRIAVAVDSRRVDVTVPSGRPLAEFLPQLVELTGVEHRPTTGWHLMRIGGELLDPQRSLAEAAVIDGELIQLAPALAAPDRGDVVDDVRAAVAMAAAPRRPARSTTAHLWHALAAAATAGLSLVLATGGVAGGVIAAVGSLLALAGAVALNRSGSGVDASIWAFAAIVPAGVAGWAIGRGASVTVWWVPAVVAAALAAVGAAVAVPARGAVLVPLASGSVAASVWCLVFAAGTREPGVVGGPVVIFGLVVIDLAPRLAFHALRVGHLHRTSGGDTPTRQAVDDRVRRARRVIVAANVAGATLILVGAAALAAGTDPWGWALAALSAVVLALHTRLYSHLDELVPVAAAATGVALLLVVLAILPEADWPLAAAAAGLLSVALAAIGVRAPTVRPLTRRRLARAEVACGLPLLVATVVSSGLAETLHRAGQNLV